MSKRAKATKRKAENLTASPAPVKSTKKTLSSKITELDVKDQSCSTVNKENVQGFWLMKSEVCFINKLNIVI